MVTEDQEEQRKKADHHQAFQKGRKIFCSIEDRDITSSSGNGRG